jgi:Protein of unknown function (DUF1579)
MRRAYLLALVPLLAVLSPAGASEPGQKKDQKDPQEKFEPKSRPGAGQKYLQQFAGTWDVDKTFYPRSGEPVRTRGECRQTMIQGGRFLQSEFTFHAPAGKTTGLGLIGFEPETGKFTSVWIDSRQTRMSLRQSEDKFDGQQIVLFGKSLDGDAKKGGRSRTVSRVEEGGRRIVHRQYTTGADGRDRVIMELVLTRKP